MSSILKVDTIQDQAGNNIINENSNTITIGASGDTINIIGTLQNNGGALPGDISSVVAGTGLSGGGTTGAVTINIEAAQPTITSTGTLAGFTSTGIDDNATSTAITIDSSENVLIGTTDAGYPVFGDNLTLEGSTHSGITIRSGTTSQGNLYFSDATGTGTGTYAGAISYLHSSDTMVFRSNSTERMRINSDGRLLVGKTDTARTTVGSEIRGDGFIRGTKSGGHSFDAVRTSDQGDVIRIYSENNLVGVLGTEKWGIGVSAPVAPLTVGSNSSGGQGVTGKTALFSGTHTTVYNAGNNGTFGGITIVNSDSTSNRTAAGVNFVNGNSGVSSIVGTSDTASRGDLRFITRGADNSGNTSERMRIADNGSVLIGTSTSGSAVAGDLVVNGGVFLGGSAAANELDDYEEGTWTPVINNSGVAQLSMTNNGSYYTKIGRMVYVTAELRYTGSTLSSGATIIGAGLPFTAADGPLGCSGSFIHDPGSGNSNYVAGICGAPAGTNFYFIITPGGRYLDKMYNNYYFQFAFNYRV